MSRARPGRLGKVALLVASVLAAMLAGEAVFFGSSRLAGWLLLFVLINHVYFVAVEEPGLRRRFGAGYDEYKRRVPRWMPRRVR